MVIIGAILPILLIGLLVVFYFFANKIGKKYMTIKVTHWLLSIYIGILLLSMLLAPMIVEDSAKLDTTTYGANGDQMGDFYTKLSTGKIADIDPKYLVKETTFTEYKHKQLSVETTSKYDPQIFIERKQGNEPTIEAFVYSSGLIIDGFNFSNRVKPFQIELSGDTILISTSHQEINLAMVTESFPIRQFTGESMFSNHYSTTGDSVIYLKVPKDVEINQNNLFLQFIDS